ncbi:MAG TPA: sigma-54 dependent transcriptional regulator [Polyangiaceae bacterium]|jgi:two-component system response regulator HydG|nr:sigma-54 dependent transcriptional regulator [Polyangiaceae bacterium]
MSEEAALSSESPRILVVEDDVSMASYVRDALRERGFDVQTANSSETALALVADGDFDLVITDLNMPGMSGIELCRHLSELRRDMPVVVITAFGSMETAILAIRAGAFDFVTKPFEIEVLDIAARRALRQRSLEREVKRLQSALSPSQSFEELLGESPAMRSVYDVLGRIADTDASVLISGESGTGKELVARALHRRSRRKAGPFVALNCAALPEHLLESELFGHTKGAFTDARTARTGLMAQASSGTLFLDEIGELPLGLQPKLLRALQERVVRPLGSQTELPIDIRIVAASNRDLLKAVEARTFRDDLFYRVNVVSVELPPLRERGGDVLLLAQDFLNRFVAAAGKSVKGFSAATAERLLAYDWPGNVRELQNCVERAVAMTRGQQIELDDLPDRLQSFKGSPPWSSASSPSPGELEPLEQVERRHILRVLGAVGGNKSKAAEILGVDRKTLYRRLGEWDAGRS